MHVPKSNFIYLNVNCETRSRMLLPTLAQVNSKNKITFKRKKAKRGEEKLCKKQSRHELVSRICLRAIRFQLFIAFTSGKKQVSFRMAIGNGELMHECFPRHSRM